MLSMIDERWNGFRLEFVAIDIGAADVQRDSHVPWDCKIQGVVFEPCGVLYDDSAWRHWLWQLLARMGLSSHYTPFFRVWDCEFQEDVWSGRLDLWTALDRFLRSAGMTRPDVDEVVAASRAKIRGFEQDMRPFPDVRATIRQLHADGVQIAVMAPAGLGAGKIREQLDQIGIRDFQSRVLSQFANPATSETVTWQQAALESLPGPTASWAYVGRRQSCLDVARRSGLLTVAFNHDSDVVADVYIDQFSQLGGLIEPPGQSDSDFQSAKAA